MKPIREIIIREYIPGDFETEIDGRVRAHHSREELGSFLRGEVGRLPDPDAEEKIDSLRGKIDELKYDLAEARMEARCAD